MTSDDPRDESEAARDDRNLAELLQELRVAGLGVQVALAAAGASITLARPRDASCPRWRDHASRMASGGHTIAGYGRPLPGRGAGGGPVSREAGWRHSGCRRRFAGTAC